MGHELCDEEEEGCDVAEGIVGSLPGVKRKRAQEKGEVKAARQDCKDRLRQHNAVPIMDLVGLTAPLILIVGISLAQTVS